MREEFRVPTLGDCTVPSPLRVPRFRSDSERVLADPTVDLASAARATCDPAASFEVAGPRERLFFNPGMARAGIVTCGGLCPGLNDVIRALVLELWHRYGTWTIYGFQYGYQGLVPSAPGGAPPLLLDPDKVRDIQESGGSFLKSSRGSQPVPAMVDTLERLGISMLFTIGGDGTLRGAQELHEEIARRKLPIAVVGIPKTIDNDLLWIEKTFGFETAFSKAAEAVLSAHVEAEGAPNGIGVVRLMGRESGYVAVMTALAMSHVNFVLVPEVPFELEGPAGLFEALHRRLEARQHAVIVVAEGAGQELLFPPGSPREHDDSGNLKLGNIGTFLNDEIKKYFKRQGVPVNLKYIDPSYLIRSIRALPDDSVFCMQLAQNAVHAAMAGKTGVVLGQWASRFTHVPITMAVAGRHRVDPDGSLWLNVLESTGQPPLMTAAKHAGA